MRPKKMPVLANEISLTKPRLGGDERCEAQKWDERSQSGRGLARHVSNYGILCCGAN
jgi:hypothetical protein